MLSDELKAEVEKATVNLTDKEGRGFLVEGGLVVTAAHCVSFSCEGGMTLGEFYLEDVRTALGVTFRLTPFAVEPCLDAAALGQLDDQQPAFERDVELFETFCDETKPLRLSLTNFTSFEPFPVYVYTHEGKWVTGTAQQCQDGAASLSIQFDDLIKGGTSGSPIVNEGGEVVALVSTAGGMIAPEQLNGHIGGMSYIEKGCSGLSPRPHVALPVWVVNRITARMVV